MLIRRFRGCARQSDNVVAGLLPEILMRFEQRNVSTELPAFDASGRTNAKRRGFLLALGAAGAGAAALAPRSITRVAPTAETTDGGASSGEGYRLSEHVKRYYRSAKT